MIEPDLWFTLFVLARKGAIHEPVSLTTSELGQELGVSQQTASRRVTQCVNEGYLIRSHVMSGLNLRIADKGLKALSNVYSSLEIAFAPPIEKIEIRGTVVGGLGEGAYYVDIYSTRFKEVLGFEPYSGTLNVRISDEASREAVGRMKHTPPLMVTGFSHEGRTFGDVLCYRIKVNNKVEAAIVIAQRTHHSKDILEIIAPANIRRKLRLTDSSKVILTVTAPHMAV
jgi:riboflavin kinase